MAAPKKSSSHLCVSVTKSKKAIMLKLSAVWKVYGSLTCSPLACACFLQARASSHNPKTCEIGWLVTLNYCRCEMRVNGCMSLCDNHVISQLTQSRLGLTAVLLDFAKDKQLHIIGGLKVFELSYLLLKSSLTSVCLNLLSLLWSIWQEDFWLKRLNTLCSWAWKKREREREREREFEEAAGLTKLGLYCLRSLKWGQMHDP